jgi:hypothetical protein
MESEISVYMKLPVLSSVSLLHETFLQQVHIIPIKDTIIQALMRFEVLIVVMFYIEVN